MREINFRKDMGKLRPEVIKIEVDEEELSFEEGLAIANATVYLKNGSVYHWYGIITENYEEVMGDLKDAAVRSLLFMPNTMSISRNNNGFIVYKYGSVTYYNFVILEECIPSFSLIEKSHIQFTETPDIIIADNALYNIERKKKVTRDFVSLTELGKDKYLAVDCIGKEISKANENNEFLHFVINNQGTLISPVISSQEKEEITITGNYMNYEKFREFKEMDFQISQKELEGQIRSLIKKYSNNNEE